MSLNARLEYFNDADGVIFGNIEGEPSEILGASTGLDLCLFDGFYWRTEFRYLHSDSDIFKGNADQYHPENRSVTTALTWRF